MNFSMKELQLTKCGNECIYVYSISQNYLKLITFINLSSVETTTKRFFHEMEQFEATVLNVFNFKVELSSIN